MFRSIGCHHEAFVKSYICFVVIGFIALLVVFVVVPRNAYNVVLDTLWLFSSSHHTWFSSCQKRYVFCLSKIKKLFDHLVFLYFWQCFHRKTRKKSKREICQRTKQKVFILKAIQFCWLIRQKKIFQRKHVCINVSLTLANKLQSIRCQTGGWR